MEQPTDPCRSAEFQPRDRRAAMWIALVAFAFHLLFAHGYVDNIDSRLHLASALQLVDTGSMSLTGRPEAAHRFARRTDDGRSYMQYGPAAVLPFLPAALVVRASGGAFGIADDKAVAFLASAWSPAAGAVAAALVFLILRRLRAPPVDAAWGAFLHAAGTYALYYSRSTYYDATLAVLVLAAAWAVLSDRDGLRGAWFGGAFFAWAIGTKVALLVLAPAFAALVLLDGSRRRVGRLAAFAALPVTACALLMWWNLHRFGSPLDTGYGENSALRLSAIPGGVVRQLVDPRGGWVLCNPSLVLAVPGVVMLARVRPALAAGGVLAGLGLICLAGAYVGPPNDPVKEFLPLGGTCFGARYLLPATAFASIAAALALARARRSDSHVVRIGAWVLVAAGVAAQVPGLVVQHQEHWHVAAALTPAERAEMPPRVVHDAVLAWEKIHGRDDPWDLARVGGQPSPDGSPRPLAPLYPALPGPAVWWARAASVYGRPWVAWGIVPCVVLLVWASVRLRRALREPQPGAGP